MRGRPLILNKNALAAVLAVFTTLTSGALALAGDQSATEARSRASQQDTLLISRAADGGMPNGPSTHGVISGDRRWARIIAYQSEASNIVAGDTNGVSDVFFTRRRGRFTNTGPGAGQPWRGGAARLVSKARGGATANGPSFAPSVAGAFRARPRCVAFLSDATNLVPRDTNGQTDAFLSRGPGRRVRRVSLPRGRQSFADTSAVAVNGNCSKVAFVNGGRLFVRRGRRTWQLRNHGAVSDPSWSQGLRYGLVFADRGGVYLSSNGRRRPRRVARGSNPAYNDIKNRVVAYEKQVGGSTQIAYRKLGGRERFASRRGSALGNADSRDPVIGNSGFYVAFETGASNLGVNSLGRTGDGNSRDDVYLFTDVRDITLVQSVRQKAEPVRGGGENPSMSFYANYMLWDSPAPLGSSGGNRQVYMRYLGGL